MVSDENGKKSPLKKKHYDVGLVTFGFANNYGAILTAHSLYRYVKEDLNKSVLMISKPKFWWPGFGEKHSPLAIDFSSKHGEFSEIYQNNGDIKELNSICDTFIVGSDQMWNYELYKTAGHYTFLDFVNKDRKKIAYATSFGHSFLLTSNLKEISKIKTDLMRFDAISVREDSGVKLCKDVFNVDAVSKLDAVFLTNRETYSSLTLGSKLKLPKKYVFAYLLDGTPEKEVLVNSISKKLKRQCIVAIDAGDVASGKKINMNLEITDLHIVEDWLKCVKNADFIVTDSFHGFCFAIIFEKQFVCVKNKGRGATRFESLLSKLDLLSRMVENPEESTVLSKVNERIDYKKVYEKLNLLIDESKDWLKTEIDKPKKIKNFYPNNEMVGPICQENDIHGMYLYRGTYHLGLKPKVSIDEVVRALPFNSIFQQDIGELGKTISGIPEPFGVLMIIKTTDHFVHIQFTRTTISNKDPEIYVAKWQDNHVISWIKMATISDITELENRISKIESRILRD